MAEMGWAEQPAARPAPPFDGDPAVGALLRECFPTQAVFAERDWWGEQPRWRVKLVLATAVISYCSGVFRYVQVNGVLLPALMVGQVSTTGSMRRRGYAASAVAALERLSYGSCAIALLTTNSPWVYEPMGYEKIEGQLPWGMVKLLPRVGLLAGDWPTVWDETAVLDKNGPDW